MWEWCQKGLPSMYKHEELFSGVWPGAQAILCFSSGYFVYDQVDMLRRHLYNPWAPSLLVHHAVLLVCFTMALYRQVTINYLILTLFCEVCGVVKFTSLHCKLLIYWIDWWLVSFVVLMFLQLHSVFLHLRRVLRMAGIRKDGSWSVMIEWSFNWITFFTSRIATHIFITCKLIFDVSKFPAGIEWPLAITGMIGLNVLNIILGLDLLNAFQKERTIWKKQEKIM